MFLGTKQTLELLKRAIICDARAKEDEQRQILLQWDQMIAFCRYCQKPDHCRADCQDYHKWAICYYCNKRGHVSKNSDRNNSGSVSATVRAVDRTPTKPSILLHLPRETILNVVVNQWKTWIIHLFVTLRNERIFFYR